MPSQEVVAWVQVFQVISNNPEAYQQWARTMPQRSQFLAKTLAMAQLEKSDNGNEHCDVRPTETQ